METLDDIIREVRAYGSQPPPRLMWLDIADRIEAAHKAALADQAEACAVVWSTLLDAAEQRERAAMAMYKRLKAAAQYYIGATCGLPGANSEAVIQARQAVEEAMKGGAE